MNRRKRVSRRSSRKRVSRRRKNRSKRKFGASGCGAMLETNRPGISNGKCNKPACKTYIDNRGKTVGYCKEHRPIDEEEIIRRGLKLEYNVC